MTCELSKPDVLVQWKKGAVLLRPGDKYEIRQDGRKLRLTIHDVKGLDSGNYKCSAGDLITTASVVVKGMAHLWVTVYTISAKSYIGKVNQIKMFHFTISEQPLFFHEELKNLEAVEGEIASFCCKVSKLGVVVQWRKGTAVLKPGNKYEMKQNDYELQLKIHDLTNHDSGAYKCCTGGIVTTALLQVKGRCDTL